MHSLNPLLKYDYIYAGKDATICKGDSYTLKGIFTLPGKSIWKTSGNGHFENNLLTKTVYIPGDYDIATGKVSLSLHVLPASTPDFSISDAIVLSLRACIASDGIDENEWWSGKYFLIEEMIRIGKMHSQLQCIQ